MTNSFKLSHFVHQFCIFSTLLFCALPIVTLAQSAPPSDSQATALVEGAQDHFHGGSDLTFKMKLNEPLPEGARFDVRLSPVAMDQELTVSSGEASNKERTEFILKTKLPEKAVPGDWHIKVVWVFLPGASWTSNTLATNADFKFVVEGPKVDVPTKGTATLVGVRR